MLRPQAPRRVSTDSGTSLIINFYFTQLLNTHILGVMSLKSTRDFLQSCNADFHYPRQKQSDNMRIPVSLWLTLIQNQCNKKISVTSNLKTMVFRYEVKSTGHWSKIFQKYENLIPLSLISLTIYTVCTYLNTKKLKSLTKQSKKMYGSIDFAHWCVRMWRQNLEISYRHHYAGITSFMQWCDISASSNFMLGIATISVIHLFLCMYVCVCVCQPSKFSTQLSILTELGLFHCMS